MRIIKTHRLPSDSDMVWTPFATFVRDDEAARLARVVASDRDTTHWLIDAVLAAAVSIDFAASLHAAVVAWIWAMLAVAFLGLAHKSASVAIVADRVERLEREQAERTGPQQPAVEAAA